jgi:Rad3-related DNA helicase
VREAFDEADVVVLAAPTGSGKTLIGETIGRMISPTRRLYVCTSKLLQDQFVRDYPYSRVLKGRSNYPTIYRKDSFHPDDPIGHVSADDCTWSLSKSCNLCPAKYECPYEQAKMLALHSNLAVLNTSYMLTEMNGPGRFSPQGFTIVDEADTMESTLMKHVSVEVGERRLAKYGWEPPSRVTVEDSWYEWLDTAIADIRLRVSRQPRLFADYRAAREARYEVRLLESLAGVRNGIPSGNWVYTGRGRNDSSRIGVSFRPARVDHLGSSFLWKHSQKWLLMSATVISSQELMDSLGCDRSYVTVNVRNTFPVKNRLVFYRGAASMSYKNRESGSWDRLSDAIVRDLREHPSHRVLVHTVSYALADHLYNRIRRQVSRPVITYHGAAEREDALQRYLRSDNAVLLAPSMGRGVDLPEDACRVQMITKVPFPYIKDRQVNKRMYSQGGRLWYAVQTVRELVQMCGRAIRSESDWATTYIYDQDFERNLWARNRNLFPDWFREAIVWRG